MKRMSFRRSRENGRVLMLALLTTAILGENCCAWCGTANGDRRTRIDNGVLRIGLDSQHGQLLEFVDLARGYNHIASAAPRGSLWEMELLVAGTKHRLAAVQAKRFSAKPLAAGLRLLWEDFPNDWAKGLRVEARVELDPAARKSRWTIRVNKPAKVLVNEIRYPRVLGLANREQERLAVPVGLGQETNDPRTMLCHGNGGKPQRFTRGYPGLLSMQFVAWYGQDGPGLYLACDDSTGMRKALAAWGSDHEQVNMEVVHHPENRAAGQSQHLLPYGVCLEAFQGDWITAARRYRTWALQQPWACQSRLHRGQVQPWALDTGLWVWNRGRSPGVLGPAEELQKRLGLPVSVFWHWWHGCIYDRGYPEYLPPREGTESFRKAVAQSHQAGIHSSVYTACRAWCASTQSWQAEKPEPYTAKTETGEPLSRMLNKFLPNRMYIMCNSTPFWQDRYGGIAEEIFTSLEVDGIYLDVACVNVPCFDPNHGHPVGGGNYWIEGFGTTTKGIRKRCDGDRSVVLAGEFSGENWLPHLDLFLNLDVSRERYSANIRWDTIPMFPAVYHRHAVNYGSYSSLTMPPYAEFWPAEHAPVEPLALLDRKYSRQFYLEQARTFVWGQQPMIANFLPRLFDDRPEEMAFLMRLARVRSRALKYLLRGEFLRPPAMNVPETDSEFSRVSIYAGRGGGATSTTKRHPLVLAGAWRADDGSMAVAVASVADKPLRLSLDFRPDDDAPQPGQAIWRIHENGREPLGRWQVGQKELALTLPPRQAWVIEFASP